MQINQGGMTKNVIRLIVQQALNIVNIVSPKKLGIKSSNLNVRTLLGEQYIL